jgi:hypothetical protein
LNNSRRGGKRRWEDDVGRVMGRADLMGTFMMFDVVVVFIFINRNSNLNLNINII